MNALSRFSNAALMTLTLGLFAALMPARAQDAPKVSAAPVFALDTLTLEAARAADSSRLAAATAAAGEAARTRASGGDTAQAAAAALDGTRPGRGSLSGRVVSEARGTVVAGARVIVAGQSLSTETDADGRFGFSDVEPGAYALFLYHASYAPLTVEGVTVTADRDASRRYPLPDKALQGEAVRITGSPGKAGEAGMLFAQKNAPSVSDGISAQQISKTPDSDAASALKRVTGISVGGDGLVYVRGLGERYVNMQLNGMTVSSPNPEKRVVPLDMFPTRLLENLVVSKTFTADQPAEFAGGSLQLRTRDYPDKRLIEFSATTGYEPGTTFQNYLTYKGGALDWLGIEDGTRALPAGIPAGFFDHRTPNLGATEAERQARQRQMLQSLPNVWTPYAATAPLNQSYGLTMGNKIPLPDGRIVGWLLGASYGTKWGVDDELNGRINVDAEGDNATYRDRYEKEVSTHEVQWGTLATATYQDGDRHKLRTNFLINRNWEDQVTRILEQSTQDTSMSFELANAYQTLLNGQVEGTHRLDDAGTRLSWVAAATSASRHEPDQRISKYLRMKSDAAYFDLAFPWSVAATSGFQERYWFDLEETGGGGKLELETSVEGFLMREGSKTRVGGFVFQKSRDYTARRLSYAPGAAIQDAPEKFGHPYEDFFELLNGAADSGYVTNRNQNEKDNYSVDDLQWAVHAQADAVLGDAWRVIAGLRVAGARVEGEARSPEDKLSPSERAAAMCRSAQCVVPFGYDRVAILPAVSAVYAVTDDQNVRASWARTFSYPEYREMSPMLFFSYQEGLETVGNIDLRPTDIYNYDLRWEWYADVSDMVAVSGFYKDFRNPVEVSIRQNGSNDRAEFVNAEKAELWGAELEARAGFGRFHEMLAPLSITANYTRIHSVVSGHRKRAMQGQSPYLTNVILFYEPFGGKAQMSLLYNRIGRRIAKVGAGNFPDVYEEGRESIEYSWSQTIVRGLKAKFTARNLTEDPKVQTQGGLVVKRIENARAYSLGVTYAF